MGFAKARRAAGMSLLILLSSLLGLNIDGVLSPQYLSDEKTTLSTISNSSSSIHLMLDWAQRGGGFNDDWINDIEIQPDGSAIIAGAFYGTATFGTTQLTSYGGKDIYVGKIDSSGNWLWAIRAGTTGDDEAVGIGLGENQSIRVAGVYCDIGTCSWNGSAYPEAYFGSNSLSSQSTNGNAFVAAVNQSGGWMWASKIYANSLGKAFDVAVDTVGVSYVVGHMSSNGDSSCGNYGVGSFSNGGTIMVAKFDQSGTCQWTKRGGNTGGNGPSNPDVPADILIDESGDIVVTGRLKSSGTFGSISVSNNGSTDMFLAKISTTGTWQFATTFGSSGDDMATAMGIDHNGDIYLTGYYSSSMILGSTTMSNNGSTDLFVAKLDMSPSQPLWDWAVSSDSPFGSSETGTGLSLSDDGNIFISGKFGGSRITLGSHELILNSNTDFLVAGLSNRGDWLWAEGAGGSGIDLANTLATDGNDIITAGSFDSSSITFSDGTVLNNSITSNYDDTFIVRWADIPLGISAITPENGTTAGNENVSINGWGFDTLPQYRREITVANPYSEAVENITFDVVDPIYDESGLIASYHLDESSGTIADSSGNDYYGTTYGNSVYGVEGKVGAAMEFDGTNNNRVELQQSLNPSSISLSAWVNPSSSQNQIIVGSSSGYYLALRANGTIEWHWWTSTGHYLYGSATVPTGVWSHITASYDDTSGASTVYLDGQIYSQISISPAALKNQSGKLGIGDCDSCSYSTFDGIIDEVRVYERALTSTEVSALSDGRSRLDYGDVRFWAANGSSLSHEMLNDGHFRILIPSMTAGETRTLNITYGAAGLDSSSVTVGPFAVSSTSNLSAASDVVAYWKLDDSSGTVVDSSGNGYHGTANGGPTYGQTGMLGDAMGFDGSNDYIDLNYYFSSISQSGFSACMWVHNERTSFTEVNALWGTDGSNEWRILLTTNGSITTEIRGSSGGASATMSNYGSGTWRHVCSVYENSVDKLVLYVDGVPVDTDTDDIGSFNQGNDQFLGCMSQSSSCRSDYDNFKGLLDEVYLFDVALSASNISSYYNMTIPILASSGLEFTIPLNLAFGGVNATNVTLVNATTINATTPPSPSGIGGMTNVSLSGWNGMSNNIVNGFEYIVPDFDGDGWEDDQDAFPNDSTQWNDTDSDGYGDNWGNIILNASRNGTVGQWVENATQVDDFPTSESAANDTDYDGHPDNWTSLALVSNGVSQDGLRLDDCPLLWGNSSADRNACIDTDWDGWSDPDANWTWVNGADNFTTNPTQWNDSDDDGYGDNWGNSTWNSTRNAIGIGQWVENASYVDWCPDDWGNSTIQRQGCIDVDGDGLADMDDAFPFDPLRGGDVDGDGYDDVIDDACPLDHGTSSTDRIGCPDADGDGYSDPDAEWTTADGADSFVNDSTQWSDQDGDNFGDNPNGTTPDNCIDIWGNSTFDRVGCIDDDGDGRSNPDGDWTWQNGADNFTNDSTQWADSDGDGFGDNWVNSPGQVGIGQHVDNATTPDSCPLEWGNSTRDRYGCSDTDGDGQSDVFDDLPNDSLRWIDSDNDGFDDLWEDNCTSSPGNSTFGGMLGCPDEDMDGWADQIDAFSNDGSQWSDFDGDGYGDNWNRIDWNNTWNSSIFGEALGIWLPNATSPDRCPSESGNSTKPPSLGCVDSDGDGWPDFNDPEPFNWTWWTDIDADDVIDENDDCIDTYGESFLPGHNGCPWPLDPPDAPANLSVTGVSGDTGIRLNLTWDSIQRWDMKQYNIYFSYLEEAPANMENWTSYDSIGIGETSIQLIVLPHQATWVLVVAEDHLGRSSFLASQAVLGQPIDEVATEPVISMFAEITSEGSEDRILVYWTEVSDFDIDSYQIFIREADPALNNSWLAWNLSYPTMVVQDDKPTNIRINPEQSIPPLQRDVELWVVILPVDESGNIQFEDVIRASVTLPKKAVSDSESNNDTPGDLSLFEQLMAGDPTTTVTRSVGVGVIILALIALIKSNLILQLIPDALRWGKLARHRIRMSAETEKEITYLQSVVTAYNDDPEEMLSELDRIESEISSRHVNKEIKTETRDIVISLVKELREMDPSGWAKVAEDQTWFGFGLASDITEREKMLQEEVAFREIIDSSEKEQDEVDERLFPKETWESRDSTMVWLQGEVKAGAHDEIISEQLKERGWNRPQIMWMIDEVHRS